MVAQKRAILFFVLLLVLLMVGGFGIALFFKWRRLTTKTQRPSGPVPVVITSPVKGAVEKTVMVSGTLMSRAEVTIVSKAAGEITDKRFSIGDKIRSGQVLYKIDDETYRAQKNQADAAVRQADAALSRAKAAFVQAEAEYQRIKRLYQSGSATPQMLDQAQAGYLQAGAGVEQAEAGLKQAAAAAELARIALENCTVTSPIDGFAAGDFQVDQGDTAGQGVPLARIVDKRMLKAVAPLPAQFVPAVEEGRTRVHIHIEGYPETVDAALTTLNPSVDPVQRAATIECVFANPSDGKGRLKFSPGSFARMYVVLEREEGLVVPASSVVNRDQADFVLAQKESLRLNVAEAGDFQKVFSRVEPETQNDGNEGVEASLLSSGRICQVNPSLSANERFVLPRSALITRNGSTSMAFLNNNRIEFVAVNTEPLTKERVEALTYFGNEQSLVCVCPPLPDKGFALLPHWALTTQRERTSMVVLRDGQELNTVPVNVEWFDRSSDRLGVYVAECGNLAPVRFRLQNKEKAALPARAFIHMQNDTFVMIQKESALILRRVQAVRLDNTAKKDIGVPDIKGEWFLIDIQPGKDEYLLLPSQAVFSVHGVDLVSRIIEYRMLLAPVRIGLASSTRVIVREGLNPDAVIMKEGVLYAYDGAHVRVTGETRVAGAAVASVAQE